METVTLAGTKHGTGTSTTAAALARYLAGYPARVELIDGAPAQDLAAVVGMGAGLELGATTTLIDAGPSYVGRSHLTLTAGTLPADDRTAFRVIDAGTLDDLTPADFNRGPVLAVARECYLSLRRATASPHLASCAGIVLIEEPGRPLGASDVANVLDLPILARIPYRMNIARAVDAGVLIARMPDELRRGVLEIARSLNLRPELAA